MDNKIKYENSDYLLDNQKNIQEDRIYKYFAVISKHLYFKNIDTNNKKVLDYGCGLGQNIYLIHNSSGYDISELSKEYFKKYNLNFINNLNNQKVDIILHSNVLEHLENPLENLKEIYNLLNDNGKLILILPVEKIDCFIKTDLNKHLYTWNPRTIKNLLELANFKFVSYDYIKVAGYNLLSKFNLSEKIYIKLITLLSKFIKPKTELRIICEK